MPFLPPNQQCQTTEGRRRTAPLECKKTFSGRGSAPDPTGDLTVLPKPRRWWRGAGCLLPKNPAGDVSHKPGGRLPLLSARPAVTPATLKKADTNFAAW